MRFWTLILALIAVLIVNLDMAAIGATIAWLGSGSILPILLGIAVFLAACGLVWLISRIWWRATGYRLTDEEVSLKRGVLNTQLRTARYDRIQAVDVVESVIARIFRLAAVRVETAGGGESVIEIAYLPREVAEQLRTEVLGRSRGTAPAEEAAPEPARRVVVPQIPITRSLAGAALQGLSISAVLVILGLMLTPLTWAAAVPIAIGIVPVIWNQIDSSWQFTAHLADDTLHLSYGLADRRRQSIPLRRIHGVKAHQPILWRIPGWWYVQVSVAGYGAEGRKGTGTTRVLPVGSREQAMQLLELVGPLDAVTIEAAARPEGATTPTFTSPPAAKWVSPVDLHQQAVTLLDDAVVVHRGRLARRVKIIHPAHIQEISLTRGPLQQLFGLCTVRFDLVPGPVTMAGEDLSPGNGRALLDALRGRELRL
nr:PH domain-containing protein [Corynebacterium lemuris]